MKTSFLGAACRAACGLLVCVVLPALTLGAELKVGAASVDITPSRAVALWGLCRYLLITRSR